MNSLCRLHVSFSCFHSSLFCVCRLTVLRLDPSIPPPTPHCPVARGATTLQGAAAEAPTAPRQPRPLLLLLLAFSHPPLRFYRTVLNSLTSPPLSIYPLSSFLSPSSSQSLLASLMGVGAAPQQSFHRLLRTASASPADPPASPVVPLSSVWLDFKLLFQMKHTALLKLQHLL